MSSSSSPEHPAPSGPPTDLEMADLLHELGMGRKASRVLAVLTQVDEARSRDLEDACGLRQPEVSVATLELRERGWVEAEPRKAGGRGRPVHHYRLDVPVEEIVGELADVVREDLRAELARIARVRELVLA